MHPPCLRTLISKLSRDTDCCILISHLKRYHILQVDLIDARCLWACSLSSEQSNQGRKSLPDVFKNQRRIKQFSSESKLNSHQGHIAEKQNPLAHSHEDVEITNNQKSQMYILVIHSSLQQN